LLPFEKAFLDDHDVSGCFVGHPLADEISAPPDRDLARQSLGIETGEWLAILPGSRMGEVKYLAPEFLAAVQWLLKRRPGLKFLVPAASAIISDTMNALVKAAGLEHQVKIIDGQAREVLVAADAALLASGTVTLEAMLVRRPMVVSYKVSALTAWVLRRSGFVTVDRFSLPNLLADEALVAEILQEEATGENLGAAVLQLLEDQAATDAMLRRFDELAGVLRTDASERAADGISRLLESS
jgi:lipid-A-disaccharide synthase